MPTPTRAERSVFRDRRRAGWILSVVVHVGAFALFMWGVVSGPTSTVEAIAKTSVAKCVNPQARAMAKQTVEYLDAEISQMQQLSKKLV